MIWYSRDYAIIFGFGHIPLTSYELFRRASSEAICGRDLQNYIYFYNVYTHFIQVLIIIPKVQKQVVYWSSHLGPNILYM